MSKGIASGVPPADGCAGGAAAGVGDCANAARPVSTTAHAARPRERQREMVDRMVVLPFVSLLSFCEDARASPSQPRHSHNIPAQCGGPVDVLTNEDRRVCRKPLGFARNPAIALLKESVMRHRHCALLVAAASLAATIAPA